MPAGALPPAPPPSPSRRRVQAGGLVSGTGRLKHVKRRQLHQPQHPIPQPTPTPTPQPAHALTPREQFAQFYGFTLPPPLPLPEHSAFPYEYDKPIHFPTSIANSDSSSSTSSTSSSSDRWSYSSSPQPAPYCRAPPPAPQFRRSASCRAPSMSPITPPLDHDELLAKFNDQFVHSRTQSASEAPVSPTKRERSIVPHGAEGKLLVPDVKLKVRCSSSASLESAASRTPSSRRSPLSAPSSVNEFNKQVFTSLTLKRPSFETRAWSYDNVPTYPIMQLPPKKEMRIVKKIVDGEEKEVEMEVAVFEVPKKLFLFAPKVVLR